MQWLPNSFPPPDFSTPKADKMVLSECKHSKINENEQLFRVKMTQHDFSTRQDDIQIRV